MFRKLYLETRVGRLALYALFSALFIAGYLVWSRPPPFQSMTHDFGVFESGEFHTGLGCGAGKAATDYVLRVRLGDSTFRKLKLFESCGDRYKHVFVQLVGQPVEVWSKDDVVYQIKAGSSTVIDYPTRVRELKGNPLLQLVYGVLCLVAFAVFTAVRYRRISRSS